MANTRARVDGGRSVAEQGAGREAAVKPPTDGRARPIVQRVTPSVEGGRYPAKRIVGDLVVVEADAFVDGHDHLRCEVRWRSAEAARWSSSPMRALGNDRWQGTFTVPSSGRYEFVVRAGVDRFTSWRKALDAKVTAGQAVDVDLLVGAGIFQQAAATAGARGGAELARVAERLRSASAATDGGIEALAIVADDQLVTDVIRHQEFGPWVTSPAMGIEVDRPRAGFSSWYELFPRSASPDARRPGTLEDVRSLLPYVARLGFDVLYLPPIHPIGATNRKGRDGAALAEPLDPGSPWAIGSREGGHTAIDPSLGTLDDFDRLVAESTDRGIEIALDLAFQCSPDHPWVHEHPEWFRRLPNGSIAFAENPPKRYEDVYPLDFESEQWFELWQALHEVVLFWIERGVQIFRVDNPHTKSLRFWQWLIRAVRSEHPDVLFLAEAFTRPRIMEHLAKIGFHQSYTYFTWRNAKWELESYLTELTRTEVVEYLRPNFWPNTPDILHATLQHGGRASFMARLILAGTMTANFGIYGPAFELQEHLPRHEGSEEYLHSEKYEVRHWDLQDPRSLSDLIGRINAIRRSYRCLQQNRTLRFHHIDNDALIAYSKSDVTGEMAHDGSGAVPRQRDGLGLFHAGHETILVIVNLDPFHAQSGWVALDLAALGLADAGDQPFQVHDLLTEARYQWQGPWNFVRLDPGIVPAHVFAVGRGIG